MQSKVSAIAIASGHTSSLIAFFDARSESLKWASGQSISIHSVEPKTAIERLRRSLSSMSITKEQLSHSQLVMCVPGISCENHRLKASAILEGAFSPEEFACLKGTRFVDDTIASLIGEIGDLDGICAFSGTGSSVFCGYGMRDIPEVAMRPRNSLPSDQSVGYRQVGKVDGWGPLLGDFGSGFRLGTELLSTALRNLEAHEKNKEKESLYHWLAKFDLDLAFPSDVQHWFDTLLEDNASSAAGGHSWIVRISRLVAPVAIRLEGHSIEELDEETMEHPTSATALAYSLFVRAAADLANSVEIGRARIPDDTDIPIVCQGGMFRHSTVFTELFQRELRGAKDNVARSVFHPVVGTLLQAMTQGFGLPSQATVKKLHQKLNSDPSCPAIYKRL